MSFNISDTLQLSFYLNGVELPLAPSNIDSLLIVSNVNSVLPTLRIDIIDDKHIFFNEFTIVDGSVFTLALGDNTNTASQESYDFMVIGMPEKIITTRSVKYTFYGVLAYPKYWKTNKPYHFSGTSYQALQNIANLVGLSFSGNITNDKMEWFNGNYSYAQLVSYITDYSYINDYSCMLSFVDVLGNLKLIDCMGLKPKWKVTNLHESDVVSNTYKYTDINFSSENGLYNFSYGYNNSLVEYGLTDSLTTNNNKVTPTKPYSTQFNMNFLLYKRVESVGSDIMSINVGNCHANWSKAKYQNLRFKSLFSNKAEIYFNSKTPIQIGDSIELEYMNYGMDIISNNIASNWVVEAKSFGISSQRYTEKLLISTTGFKDLDNSNLL